MKTSQGSSVSPAAVGDDEGVMGGRVPGRRDGGDDRVAELDALAVLERAVREVDLRPGRQIGGRAGRGREVGQAGDVVGLHVRLEHGHDVAGGPRPRRRTPARARRADRRRPACRASCSRRGSSRTRSARTGTGAGSRRGDSTAAGSGLTSPRATGTSSARDGRARHQHVQLAQVRPRPLRRRLGGRGVHAAGLRDPHLGERRRPAHGHLRRGTPSTSATASTCRPRSSCSSPGSSRSTSRAGPGATTETLGADRARDDPRLDRDRRRLHRPRGRPGRHARSSSTARRRPRRAATSTASSSSRGSSSCCSCS